MLTSPPHRPSALTGLPPLPSALFSPLPLTHEGTDAISPAVAIARGRVSCLRLSVWSVWGVAALLDKLLPLSHSVIWLLDCCCCCCVFGLIDNNSIPLSIYLDFSFHLSVYLLFIKSIYLSFPSPYPIP